MDSDFISGVIVQVEMGNIRANTCDTWQNCNEITIQ